MAFVPIACQAFLEAVVYRIYLTNIQKLTKWQHPSKNTSVGDVVLLREDGLVPSQWPLAKVTKIHTGKDGLV